jgi:hypothetical protein
MKSFGFAKNISFQSPPPLPLHFSLDDFKFCVHCQDFQSKISAALILLCENPLIMNSSLPKLIHYRSRGGGGCLPVTSLLRLNIMLFKLETLEISWCHKKSLLLQFGIYTLGDSSILLWAHTSTSSQIWNKSYTNLCI